MRLSDETMRNLTIAKTVLSEMDPDAIILPTIVEDLVRTALGYLRQLHINDQVVLAGFVVCLKQREWLNAEMMLLVWEDFLAAIQKHQSALSRDSGDPPADAYRPFDSSDDVFAHLFDAAERDDTSAPLPRAPVNNADAAIGRLMRTFTQPRHAAPRVASPLRAASRRGGSSFKRGTTGRSSARGRAGGSANNWSGGLTGLFGSEDDTWDLPPLRPFSSNETPPREE